MEQPEGNGVGGGKIRRELRDFDQANARNLDALEYWINRFRWGVIAKHGFNPMSFYFEKGLTLSQITALTADVMGKNREEADQTLISNPYLCIGKRIQDELRNRKPHQDLSTTTYPRILDEIEEIFKKERNATFETYHLLSRKQRDEERLDHFHSVISGLAARFSLGTLERRTLREVFIANMAKLKEAQTEFCMRLKRPTNYTRLHYYKKGETIMPKIIMLLPVE